MSGNGSAFQSMLDSMVHGCRVALLGLFPAGVAIDCRNVIFKGLLLKGIYGREMFETWSKMAALIHGGLDLTPIITHHFPIADVAQGFDAMNSGRSGKVILEWTRG